MASSLYDAARAAFLGGGAQINWTVDTIKACLVDTGAYTVDLAAHQFLSSVPGGAIIAAGVALGSKTNTAGVADAADTTFTAVSGTSIEAVVIYKDTGSSATSPLIAYIDTATGLPVTPNGSDIVVQWDNGSNKIFKL